MIVGETASVCPLPAPVKPKRCFRFPPALSLSCPRPDFSHRFFNLGDEAARKYFVGGGRQRQNVQISTERERAGKGGREAGEGLSKKLKHYLHFSYDTTTIYYPPQPRRATSPCLSSSWQEDCRLCSPKTSIHVAVAVAVVAGDAM